MGRAAGTRLRRACTIHVSSTACRVARGLLYPALRGSGIVLRGVEPSISSFALLQRRDAVVEIFENLPRFPDRWPADGREAGAPPLSLRAPKAATGSQPRSWLQPARAWPGWTSPTRTRRRDGKRRALRPAGRDLLRSKTPSTGRWQVRCSTRGRYSPPARGAYSRSSTVERATEIVRKGTDLSAGSSAGQSGFHER